MIQYLKTFSNEWMERSPQNFSVLPQATVPFFGIPVAGKGESLEKRVNQRRKRMWFLGMAAPIPGVSVITKQKSIF
jgi:hypothetical protein